MIGLEERELTWQKATQKKKDKFWLSGIKVKCPFALERVGFHPGALWESKRWKTCPDLRDRGEPHRQLWSPPCSEISAYLWYLIYFGAGFSCICRLRMLQEMTRLLMLKNWVWHMGDVCLLYTDPMRTFQGIKVPIMSRACIFYKTPKDLFAT